LAFYYTIYFALSIHKPNRPAKDGDLNSTKSYRKPRAIVEVDTDSCYVLTEETIEISDNVKTFDRFIDDVEIWLSQRKSDIQSS
jgi:hypothetical protein